MNKAKVKRKIIVDSTGAKYSGYLVKFNLTEEELCVLRKALFEYTSVVGVDIYAYLTNALTRANIPL
jgi:hypothetical protein